MSGQNQLKDPKKQDRGSAEPMPGRCGAKLRRSDPPRYCTQYPMKGRTRCRRCGGATPIGSASPNFKHGRSIKSQFDAVLPAALRKHLDPARVREAASCSQQLLLVDARTGQVLESIREHDPTGVVAGTRAALGLLRLSLLPREGDSAGSATARAEAQVELLERLLDQQAAVATGWDELHRLFATRANLARTEINYQKLLSENILLGQVTTFMAALVAEARMLTEDRRKLSDYARRVAELGRGLAPALAAGSGDVVEAEVVDEWKMDGGEEKS